MVAQPKIVDVDARSELHHLLEDVRTEQAPVILRESGVAIAVIHPLTSDAGHAARALSPAEIRAFQETAGGWDGLVDTATFLHDNDESRERSSSPVAEW